MIHTIEPISPLRQRLIEDMRMRKLSPKTQTQYIRWVKALAVSCRRRNFGSYTEKRCGSAELFHFVAYSRRSRALNGIPG
jgi:hypothetical protein